MKNKALGTKINETILEDYFKQMWRLQENQVKFCALFNSFLSILKLFQQLEWF